MGRKPKAQALIAAAALAGTFAAHAQMFGNAPERIAEEAVPGFYNGNTLYKLATASPSMFRGYVVGVHDSTKLRRLFCTPDAGDAQQVGDIVLQFLQNNPQRRAEQAQGLVVDALGAAWPCPRRQ